MLPYTVKVKYAKGPEQAVATFKQRDEAIEYIQKKLQKDNLMKVETIYQLWELGEMEKSYDQSALQSEGEGTGTSSGSIGTGTASPATTGGQTSGQNFRPSPLQSAPRPPGMPANNWKDDPKDTEK